MAHITDAQTRIKALQAYDRTSCLLDASRECSRPSPGRGWSSAEQLVAIVNGTIVQT